MKSEIEIIRQEGNQSLRPYTVHAKSLDGPNVTLFLCLAEDADHAKEQYLNSCEHDNTEVTLVDLRNYVARDKDGDYWSGFDGAWVADGGRATAYSYSELAKAHDDGNSVTAEPLDMLLLTVGKTVWWNDPDKDIPSGFYEVVSVDSGSGYLEDIDTVFVLKNKDGLVAAYVNEIDFNKPYDPMYYSQPEAKRTTSHMR